MTARMEWVEQNLIQVPFVKQCEYKRATLAEQLSACQTPGASIAVIDSGETVWERGYGVAERGGAPVTPQTLFQACSISKPVAAMGVLRLVQEGRLDLDVDVNRYLNRWKVPANGSWQPVITLRQLLSHTAGATQHGFGGYRTDEPVPTLLQVLNGAPPANSGPVIVNAVPGTRFRYSGGGTTIVQMLLEDVTGRPFAQLMQELVLDPLGMAHSTYAQPLPEHLQQRAATGHRTDGEPLAGKWHIYPEMAAAGLWTTAGDLARVILAIQQARAGLPGAFLAKELIDQALTRQAPGAQGLGLFIDGDGDGESLRFRHGGSNEGFKCYLIGHADLGKGAVVMTNGDLGGWVFEPVLRTIAEAYEWPHHASYEWPCNLGPLPEGTAPTGHEALAGTYELRPGFTFVVTTGVDTLLLRPEGQPAMPLLQIGPGRFESPALNAEVRFEADRLLLVQDGATLTATRK